LWHVVPVSVFTLFVADNRVHRHCLSASGSKIDWVARAQRTGGTTIGRFIVGPTMLYVPSGAVSLSTGAFAARGRRDLGPSCGRSASARRS
jgi:hypothetical protein